MLTDLWLVIGNLSRQGINEISLCLVSTTCILLVPAKASGALGIWKMYEPSLQIQYLHDSPTGPREWIFILVFGTRKLLHLFRHVPMLCPFSAPGRAISMEQQPRRYLGSKCRATPTWKERLRDWAIQEGRKGPTRSPSVNWESMIEDTQRDHSGIKLAERALSGFPTANP